MSESSIFRDRSKLSPRYIPDELPHREKQIEQLQHAFKESYSKPDKFPLTVLQIFDPAVIGKTSTILKFSKLLEEEFLRNKLKIKTAYINLKLQGGNKYTIYRLLLERIAPELPAQGLSAEEMLRYLLHYLYENKTYVLIILDEIDYLIKVTKGNGIVYDLTRLNEFDPDKPCNVKGVIFIARSTEFYNKLDSAELSSLGRVTIDQIRKVHGQIHPTITTEEIEHLSKNHVFTLMALIRALRLKKREYVDLKEIRIHALQLAEEFKLKKLDIEDYLDDLHIRNVIEIRSLKEIGIHGASLQELEPILQRQIKHGDNDEYRKKND